MIMNASHNDVLVECDFVRRMNLLICTTVYRVEKSR